MKLKQSPNDFKVEEIIKFNVLNSGNYRLYLLEKTGLEGFFILSYLAKKNNIPVNCFGIAGLKDKHAVTKQYFTIPNKYEIKTLNEKGFKIKFAGFVEKEIRLGDLEGNKFEIIVRDIKKGEFDGVYQKAKTLSEIGVPNYFDSQRFGSVFDKEFIAKDVINKNYEKAVKIFLTKYSKFEKRKLKDEKREIEKNWNNLSKLKIKNKVFSLIINEYLRSKDWLKTYKKIPENLREMYVSAYQSYLWNECIKEVLRRKINKKYLYSVEYALGSLLFYKRVNNEILETFKTISDEIKANEFENGIINKILEREGIKIDEFKIKRETGDFFKTHERKVIVKPENFKISEPLIDELNDKGKKNIFKIKIEFDLTKGSYATIITKRLFNK